MSTREERAEATRAQLLAVARELFAARGYAGVGTEDVVRGAGLTRGALYHHFADKRELFAAVHEQLEQEIVASIGSRIATVSDPVELLLTGMTLYLDSCMEPAVLRITLLDAPTVLGWPRWREIDARYGLGLVMMALTTAMDAGALRTQPVRPLAHLLLAALAEAAQLIAHAPDPEAARAEMEPTLLSILDGLRT
ncbi:TetR/AcrR family transcriptional regulator [Pseudonocardia spinosispora]|uniref:TetR/AcrR family transcriptional regulator n=1 Tax=Pseudonocardia spinosispora TaxID=103441 RepID=UPI0004270477|nr:TetR/AcrR family transcriptional regulator [Pseudonocardia spinosispora]